MVVGCGDELTHSIPISTHLYHIFSADLAKKMMIIVINKYNGFINIDILLDGCLYYLER